MNPLKHVPGKVVIACDLESKNSHTFAFGLKIRVERQFNNLNRRETEPVNAIVISAGNIPEGAEILIHPNAPTDTNRIFNHGQLSGEVEGSDIKFYSISEDQCFLWLNENKEWQPIFPYETALRVFKPYSGFLIGIEPTVIKDTLYVTSGEFKGQVVRTLKAVDYEVIFQGINGTEERIIRFRPNGDEKTKREPEAIALDNKLTKEVEDGEILVGLSVSDAKSIQITAYAD